jgi:hypothetical protein
MPSLNLIVRFSMRTTLLATLLLAAAGSVLGQDAPVDARAKVLTIRVSDNGVCYFQHIAKPCSEIGQYLVSTHLARDSSLRIVADSTVRYEMIEVTIKSLQDARFGKLGVVNSDVTE